MPRPFVPFVAALLLTLCGVAVVPAAAQAQTATPTPNVRTTTRSCGAYTVRLDQNGFDEPDDRVSLTLKGVTAVTLHDVSVEAQFCRDLTGDGVPEVMLMQYSGGAHCCSIHSLYSLTTPPRLLLREDSADTYELTPRQLDGQGPLELVSGDWRFAYAYGLSFAESPALPVVYVYRNGQYVDRTRRFPGVLLGRMVKSGPEFGAGYALYDYGALLLAGPPGDADRFVQGLPEGLRAWLVNYGPDIRQALGDFGLRDWPVLSGLKLEAARTGLGGAFTVPGTRQYLALAQERGGAATLRLYSAQGEGVVAGPALQGLGALDGADFSRLKVLPAFTVRRSTGRDDAVFSDTTSGSLRYTVLHVDPDHATPLNDDALAVATQLLADFTALAGQVASQYAETTRTAAQKAEIARRIQASTAQARSWLAPGPVALGAAPLDLSRLVAFQVNALEMPGDTATSAQVMATLDAGLVPNGQRDSYIPSERYTARIDLVRTAGGWTVHRWTLTRRPGELPQ